MSDFTQEGIGAQTRTIESKLQESVSILDFIPVSEHAAIRAGTSTFDCHSAIMAAINSRTAESSKDVFVPKVYVSGPAIYFPLGIYNCSQTIELKKSVRLYGDGSGLPWSSVGTLQFPAGISGITVNRYNTLNGGVEDVPTTAADSSIIEGLRILGSGGATAHGIWLRARALIRNCYISGFSGNGIQVVAGTGGSDGEGNANNFRIESGRIDNCGGHGIFTRGNDVNAGYVMGVDCTGNRGWGIYDNSFLGNTYIACHVDANALGAYKSPGAPNIFIGCYSESGQPSSDISFPAMVVGGVDGAGLAGDFINLNLYPNKVSWSYKAPTGESVSVDFGNKAGGDDSAVLSLATSDLKSPAPNSPYRLHYTTGKWYLDWANLGIGQHLHLYDRAATTANGFTRDMNAPPFDAGGIGFPSGYFGGSMRYRGEGVAPPIEGTWLAGDIIYNIAPASGGFIGWVCTEPGTPGTWKTFGAIS